MKKFVVDCWNHVMDAEVNPLRHIPDLQVRHMIMQVLAFMWSGVFAIAIADSVLAFGISAVVHILFIAAVVVTVGTFKVAEKQPSVSVHIIHMEEVEVTLYTGTNKVILIKFH